MATQHLSNQKRSDHNIQAQLVDLNSESDKIREWVQKGINEDTIEFANNFGQDVKRDLTTSQIRAAFGEMRRIQMNNFEKEKTAFILLKPKLAYAVKRHNKDGLTKFFNFFSIAYDAVDTSENNGHIHYTNLMQLMEAVLAYHKYHGGKE